MWGVFCVLGECLYVFMCVRVWYCECGSILLEYNYRQGKRERVRKYKEEGGGKESQVKKRGVIRVRW